jgi:Protein of unknown function (DUF2721)
LDPQPNPFAALSMIVAPAILTNASSVLAMSTSNRLARAVDRARELARQLEGADPHTASAKDDARRLEELDATERRVEMLLLVLRSFYIALGGFASATLASLLGAVLAIYSGGPVVTIFEVIGVGAGMVGVGSLVRGSAILVRETGIAVQVIHKRAATIRSDLASRR